MSLLKDFIIESIHKKGKITFAEFMQIALYHPQHGYYNSDKERMGKSGDYYTSPTVHRIFGELIAKQLEEMWKIMGGGEFTVVEMGANRGWLCYDIFRYVQKEYPVFYDHLHYLIIESNPHVREKQRLPLESLHLISDNKVSWRSYTGHGFSLNNVQGCFLSNEFVDALPVHRITVNKGVLKEIYVGYHGEQIIEIEDEVSTQELKNYLENYRIHLRENLTYEINLEAIHWIQHVSEKLHKGFVITIDYGDTFDGIYRGNNSNGTLRCFYRHTLNQDYYERPGEQDITAHVDFTSLMNAGRVCGLEVTGFTKQSHFLIALGIIERLNNNLDAILKIKNLIHPEGMGEIFKVLIQHKNIKNPQLTGLRPLHSIKI